MSKRVNSYTLISIVTLVIMTFMFMRMLQVNHWFANQSSPAYQVYNNYQGRYILKGSNSDVIYDLVPMDTLDETGWIRIREEQRDILHARISDFEDEQVLIELFMIDSLGQVTRRDGCELLLHQGEESAFTGETLGELCAYSEVSQTFQKLKINLANPYVRVDIVTRHAEMITMVSHTALVLKKEEQK